MKKYLFILGLVLFSVVAMGQRTLLDTVTDAGTVTFAAMEQASQVQVLCTSLSGTPAGSVTIEGSVDGVSWETLTTTVGIVKIWPSDTLTIADAAVQLTVFELKKVVNFVRVKAVGSGTQSTEITVKWSK
jgi:hypothetical protein